MEMANNVSGGVCPRKFLGYNSGDAVSTDFLGSSKRWMLTIGMRVGLEHCVLSVRAYLQCVVSGGVNGNQDDPSPLRA